MRYFISIILGFVSTSVLALPAENAHALSQNELIRVISGLFLVLIIIFVLSWLVKRLHGVHFGSTKGFESIGSMILGPKEKIMLLKVGERYLLMGVASGGINLLCDFGTERPEGFNSDQKPSFSQVLKSAVGK